jgi:hypothetical protein
MASALFTPNDNGSPAANNFAANLLSNAASVKQTLSTNYIDFTSAGTAGWAQQYLPDLYEAEVERYGDRTVGGFLQATGSEMPMSSDQIIWTEQGRLHISYTDATVTDASANTITLPSDHAVRVGQTIVIKGKTSDRTSIAKAYVSNVAGAVITALPYATATLDTPYSDSDTIDLFVFGSEFKKGDTGMSGAVTPQHISLTNKPIILKDKYEISGSDASQIGWVEVTGESGQTGYLWYIKAEGDTRSRFEDYLEMAMVEAEKAEAASTIDTSFGVSGDVGTEGLFSAIESRGHTATGFLDGNAADDLADFDNLLKILDKEGAIEENMLFVNRETALNLDDMLAAINANYSGGTSYGVFNNSEDMALNLGFSGFRRGSYDFYKTDWKYLNDASTRGLTGGIEGVLIPAGTSTVYDQVLGKNLKRPFLHVRYRASEADDRRMKTWVTGSVGGAATSDLDAMEVHYLSERCLVVQGANNFLLMK